MKTSIIKKDSRSYVSSSRQLSLALMIFLILLLEITLSYKISSYELNKARKAFAAYIISEYRADSNLQDISSTSPKKKKKDKFEEFLGIARVYKINKQYKKYEIEFTIFCGLKPNRSKKLESTLLFIDFNYYSKLNWSVRLEPKWFINELFEFDIKSIYGKR